MRSHRLGLLLLLAFSCRENRPETTSVAPADPPPTPAPAPATPAVKRPLRLLFIGIDGADWDILRPLVASGQCPNIGQVMAQGASGTLLSPPPRISPMVWTTMLTGRQPEDHGVLDFFAQGPDGKPIPVPSTARHAKAAWEILAERGLPCGVVGFWATWPAGPPAAGDAGARSVVVSDAFAPSLFGGGAPEKDLVWPGSWDARLGELRSNGIDVGGDLVRFVGQRAAGTAGAEAGDKPPPHESVTDIEKDPVRHLEEILRSTRAFQRASIEIGLTHEVEALFVYHQLVDEVCHRFMRYAPPTLPGVSAKDAAKLGRAVEAAYELEDDLVGELLGLADPSTIVVLASDHGFLSGSKRPESDPSDFAGQAAAWHREEGVVIVRGPGIVPTQSLTGTTIDVTPTLLALLAAPQAEDMPGHALLGAAVASKVASYGAPYRDSARGPTSDATTAEKMEELRALGYLGPSETAPQISGNGYVNLGLSLAARGKREESRKAYGKALEVFENHPSALFDLASSLAIDGKLEEAFPWLIRLARLDTDLPEGSLLRLADVARKLGPTRVAEARKALADGPQAHRTAEWSEAMALLERGLGRSASALM